MTDTFTILKSKDFYEIFQARLSPKQNALVPSLVVMAYPEDAKKADIYAAYLIEYRRQWNEAEKKHPKDFPSFWITVQEPFKVPEHGRDTTCICRYLAEKTFYEWFETTDDYRKAEADTQKQIDAYYKSLADEPERADAVLSEIKDGYEHWRTAKNIEEAKKLLKGE